MDQLLHVKVARRGAPHACEEPSAEGCSIPDDQVIIIIIDHDLLHGLCFLRLRTLSGLGKHSKRLDHHQEDQYNGQQLFHGHTVLPSLITAPQRRFASICCTGTRAHMRVGCLPA